MAFLFENYEGKRAKTERLGIKVGSREEGRPPVEYKEGEERLNFKWAFSGGEIFEAAENGEGVVSAKISKDGETIFDLTDLLPKSAKMASPTYFLARPEVVTGVPDRKIGKWFYSRGDKTVSVGWMKDYKDILMLLHEIGHARIAPDVASMEEKSKKLGKNEFEFQSWDERTAWAEALNMAREIMLSARVDVLQDFSGLNEIKKEIYGRLTEYRYSAEYKSSSFAGKIIGALFGTFGDKDKEKFLKDLYDKGKFVKKVK